MFFGFKITTVLSYMFFDTKLCVVCSLCSCVVSQMIVVRLIGIIHLPHGVVLPVHRYVIVNVSEWGESATSLVSSS